MSKSPHGPTGSPLTDQREIPSRTNGRSCTEADAMPILDFAVNTGQSRKKDNIK